MRLTAFCCVLACTCAAPAAADLTITSTTAGKMMVMNLGGESMTRIKGNKMRIDQTKDGNTLSTIIDIDGQRMISLDSKKKEATVMSLGALQEGMGKITGGDVKVKLTPTAETKQVAGYSCKVHDIGIAFPFNPSGKEGDANDMQMAMVMSGPTCLSKDAPGFEDYQRVYRAAAKGPGASQARALASLYRSMAEAGMPLDQQLTIGLEGNNPMVGMMNKMMKSNMTSTVTKIETGEVAADLFDVPPGYKVKQN
jgi:hypothetical protein